MKWHISNIVGITQPRPSVYYHPNLSEGQLDASEGNRPFANGRRVTGSQRFRAKYCAIEEDQALIFPCYDSRMFNFGKPKTAGDWLVHVIGAHQDARCNPPRLRQFLLREPRSDLDRQFDGRHESFRRQYRGRRRSLQDRECRDLGQFCGDENGISIDRYRLEHFTRREGLARHERRSLDLCRAVIELGSPHLNECIGLSRFQEYAFDYPGANDLTIEALNHFAAGDAEADIPSLWTRSICEMGRMGWPGIDWIHLDQVV